MTVESLKLRSKHPLTVFTKNVCRFRRKLDPSLLCDHHWNPNFPKNDLHFQNKRAILPKAKAWLSRIFCFSIPTIFVPCVFRRFLKWGSELKPAAVKGEVSKSVLFDACILAKELMKMEDKKWDMMSEVRVELLSYTAGHCRANDHAQLLSKGGELVTFVWLLMAHFGIGEQFQIKEGHARAKLIVRK